MLLPILIGLILFQYSIHPFDFPVLDKIIGSSHRLCIQLTQNHFPYNDFQTSLICGQSLKHSSFAPPLLNMGIIHLFVVSGFHVLFIENLLSKIFPKNFWLSFGILTLYGLACQFHPPITRALIHHFLKSLNLNYKLFWRTSHITLLSGLCVLILCPQWIHSASFVLSWTACIAMQFSLPTRLTPHAFFNHF
ncbi:MAG: ComEC/Rec2 family competence protein, partial [Bdellovibrionales bacterium]|nr:ComEC/Rec2 family competence protein [Bdellovibrionales bacterium]